MLRDRSNNDIEMEIELKVDQKAVNLIISDAKSNQKLRWFCMR